MDKRRADFDRFVADSADTLLRTAYLVVWDLGEAEDLVQETLFEVARRWPRVRAGGSWPHRRRPSSRRSTRRIGRALTAQIDERDELAAALAQLPPRMRTVLVLRYFLDLPKAEVAAAMKCSLGTVKSTASSRLDGHPAKGAAGATGRCGRRLPALAVLGRRPPAGARRHARPVHALGRRQQRDHRDVHRGIVVRPALTERLEHSGDGSRWPDPGLAGTAGCRGYGGLRVRLRPDRRRSERRDVGPRGRHEGTSDCLSGSQRNTAVRGSAKGSDASGGSR